MNKIITISREFGSGGREIAQQLAVALNIPYYDNEILTQISKKTKLAENYVEKIMETAMYSPFPVTIGHTLHMPNVVMEQHNNIYTATRNDIQTVNAK